jgi:hypothetical protein
MRVLRVVVGIVVAREMARVQVQNGQSTASLNCE